MGLAMTSKHQRITEARKTLGLSERATLEEIKTSYRQLLRRWHPDTSNEPKAKCEEMTAKIVGAYETIMDYCNHYAFSFSKEDVQQHLSQDEWWFERFGSDPLWGKGSGD
jgi:DnaJ-class molecular chaperone